MTADDEIDWDAPRSPDTVEELLEMARDDAIDLQAMHEVGRCHEFRDGPCQHCLDEGKPTSWKMWGED